MWIVSRTSNGGCSEHREWFDAEDDALRMASSLRFSGVVHVVAWWCGGVAA